MHVKADSSHRCGVRKFWEEQFIIACSNDKMASAAAVALHNGGGTENNTSCQHHTKYDFEKKSGHCFFPPPVIISLISRVNDSLIAEIQRNVFGGGVHSTQHKQQIIALTNTYI